MDYIKTLNLPEMDFPMKPDSAQTEFEILEIWKNLDIYEKRQRLNREKPKFLIYNPPKSVHKNIATDDILNAILTDIVVKYKLTRGFQVPLFPVWNCYTSDIEQGALDSLKSKGNEVERSEVWKCCKSLCSEYVDYQKEQLRRLGTFAYWDKATLTSDSEHQSRAIEAFASLYEAGYVYKGVKPTRWCISCQTDLTRSEIEYRNLKLLLMYVKFPVIQGLEELGEDVYVVVWTNTPWTLPANAAIAVHPDHEYVAVETKNDGILIMAANVVENVVGRKVKGKHQIIKRMKGLELYKIMCAHPFLHRDSEVLLDRNVSSTRGTGCINAMSGFDQGDITANRQYEQEIISTVDQNGRLTEEAGRFCGLNAFEASDPILLELEKRDCLLASESVKQQYPHCPRCKKPIIIRSAEKWILKSDANNLRQRIVKVLEESDWSPGWSKNKFSYNLNKRLDLSISRRRTWGIPTPVFYCSKCDLQVDTQEGINASRNMIVKKGISRWLKAKPNDIFPDDLVCSRCGGKDFQWEADILDSDFVSAMSYKVLSSNGKDAPQSADIFLGNSVQSGKWFQLSLLTSMTIDGVSPFDSVMLHGSVVDGTEEKASRNDTLSIQALLDEFGADILRFWVASVDCEKNPKISRSHLELLSNNYRRIRNTCRFLLGNLYNYDPDSDGVAYDYLQEIDHWVLHRLTKLIDGATKALEDHRPHILCRLLYHFCSVDVSSRYLSIVKRRLYASARWSSSRRSVQTVIHEILTTITRLMAPILPFAAEDIWQHIPGAKERYPSLYLAEWPDMNKNYLDEELEIRWNQLLEIRSEIYRSLEKVRQAEGICGSSQASVTLYAPSSEFYDLLDRYIDDLETIFMVSRVRLMPPDATVPDEIRKSDKIEGLAVEVHRATGGKCERCWVYSDAVGTNEQYPTLCDKCMGVLEGETYYI